MSSVDALPAALDAAQPAFEDQAPEVRIAAGDAVFVDVIHTNGVPFVPTLGFGVMQPLGECRPHFPRVQQRHIYNQSTSK